MIDISITGLGMISSVAHNIDDFDVALHNQVSGIKDFPYHKYQNTLIKEDENYKVGYIEKFDLNDYFSEKDIRSIDSSTLHILKAVDEALDDSGILNQKSLRVGVLMGSAISMQPPFKRMMKLLGAYKGDISLLPQPQHYKSCFMELFTSTPIDVICKKYGFTNYSSGLTGICASGALTVTYGHQLIQNDRLDAVVCCGFDFFYSRVNKTFAQYKLLSQNDCKPFDKTRDGFQLAEGVGVIILQKKSDAIKTYADVIGTGVSNDASHMVMPSPSGEAYAQAISQSLSESKLTPEDINYISPIGRGGVYSDIKESRGIKKVFGKYTANIPISSVIPHTGYALGAASSFNIIYTLIQMKYGYILPTLNTSAVDIKLGLDIVIRSKRKQNINHALVSSFAFAGVNTSLILKNAGSAHV